jgi:GxxExxY protein
METNDITRAIIGAAMKVHSALGPGLLERAYRVCLVHELKRLGLRVATEVPIVIVYDGMELDAGFRIDVLVEDEVIVELKAVTKMFPLFDAQMLSYLKLSGHAVGLIINFNVTHLRHGIRRLINR